MTRADETVGPGAAPVVVTDGETRAALATTRALGARGIPVHVLATRLRSLAGASRYAAAEHRVPDAAAQPELWARAVAEHVAELPGALVIPVTEIAVGTLLEFGLPGV